jgi:serine/threonine protein kinase
MRHLHKRGVMHGDFYAHNILCHPDGHALLGDFGAASFFSTQDHKLAMSLQRLEIRAFGYLLQELLQICNTPDSQASLDTLRQLIQQCLSDKPHQRPLFAELEALL